MNTIVGLSQPQRTLANQIGEAARFQTSVLVAAAGEKAEIRFLEFFASHVRNPNTRRAYARAVGEFLSWCEAHDVASIAAVQPLHVAGYIEELTQARSAPTAKQRLAAIRVLFDWLVVGQGVFSNRRVEVKRS